MPNNVLNVGYHRSPEHVERVVGPIEICLVFVPINSGGERKSDSNDVSNLWRDWRLKVYKGGKKKAKVTD